jgi:hypothetical protein
MSAKHTPGPWAVSDERHGNFYVRDAAGQQLIWLGNSSRFKPGENGANARLIAAAPELLEALENIENDDGHIPESIWSMVKEAIAKAEGRAAE